MPGSNKAVAFVRDAAVRLWRLFASGMKALPDGLRLLADMLKSVRDIVISGAVIFAVVFCVMVVMRQVWSAPPMLEPIDLPQSLIANGLTREDITDRILAQVTYLRQQATGAMEIRATPRAGTKPAHLVFGRHGNAAPAPGFVGDIGAVGRDGERKSIVIPETGISIDVISDYAKDLLGVKQLRFSGEIMAVDGCPGNPGKGYAIELREQGRGRLNFMTNCETGANALDAIVSDAAMDIVSVTEPTVAEVVLYNRQKPLAVSLARQVVAADYPDTVKARAHAIIGSAEAELRNYSGAAMEFKRAAELDADQGFIYNRDLCEALGSDGRTPLDAALAYCRASLKDNDGYASTYVSMGNVHLIHQDCAEAIADYQHALGIHDDANKLASPTLAMQNLALAHGCRAWQFDDANKPADALREFRTATSLDPYNPYLLSDMGGLLIEMNREPAAQEVLARAANLAPANGQLLISVAVEFVTGSTPDAATPYFQRAFQQDRAGAEAAVTRLATSLSGKQEYGAAAKVLTAALKGAPANTMLHLELADVNKHLQGAAAAR
jgi:tetratricopeptide (TPR) repeat protein